jgi:DNA-binding response OmpR family regulator
MATEKRQTAHEADASETDVFVVDARPEDYASLASAAAGSAFRVQHAATIDDALRLRHSAPRSIWLINVRLPDGSGCDLASAIRARDRRSIVYLVSDAYDPAEEIAARTTRGAMYVCKPRDGAWLWAAAPAPQSLYQCA